MYRRKEMIGDYKSKFEGGVESEQKVPVGLTIFRKTRDGRYRKGPSGEDIPTADEGLAYRSRQGRVKLELSG
jgi:hypothetical protein